MSLNFPFSRSSSNLPRRNSQLNVHPQESSVQPDSPDNIANFWTFTTDDVFEKAVDELILTANQACQAAQPVLPSQEPSNLDQNCALQTLGLDEDQFEKALDELMADEDPFCQSSSSLSHALFSSLIEQPLSQQGRYQGLLTSPDTDAELKSTDNRVKKVRTKKTKFSQDKKHSVLEKLLPTMTNIKEQRK